MNNLFQPLIGGKVCFANSQLARQLGPESATSKRPGQSPTRPGARPPAHRHPPTFPPHPPHQPGRPALRRPGEIPSLPPDGGLILPLLVLVELLLGRLVRAQLRLVPPLVLGRQRTAQADNVTKGAGSGRNPPLSPTRSRTPTSSSGTSSTSPRTTSRSSSSSRTTASTCSSSSTERSRPAPAVAAHGPPPS